jgi:hypothetical protein
MRVRAVRLLAVGASPFNANEVKRCPKYLVSTSLVDVS